MYMLASFFLPSHLSLTHVYTCIVHVHVHAVYCTVLTGVGGGPASQSVKEIVQRSVETSASAANLILIHLQRGS